MNDYFMITNNIPTNDYQRKLKYALDYQQETMDNLEYCINGKMCSAYGYFLSKSKRKNSPYVRRENGDISFNTDMDVRPDGTVVFAPSTYTNP